MHAEENQNIFKAFKEEFCPAVDRIGMAPSNTHNEYLAVRAKDCESANSYSDLRIALRKAREECDKKAAVIKDHQAASNESTRCFMLQEASNNIIEAYFAGAKSQCGNKASVPPSNPASSVR